MPKGSLSLVPLSVRIPCAGLKLLLQPYGMSVLLQQVLEGFVCQLLKTATAFLAQLVDDSPSLIVE